MVINAISRAKEPRAIKTPQSLIHIKHRISLLQYKYWILLLRELREQFDAGTPPDENGFRFVSMDKIEAAIGYVPNKAEFFKDLLALKNETIAFNVLEKDGQEAKYGAGFISEWKITSQRVAFKFPSVLENVMRGLEEPKAIFQLLNWSIFNHFSGKYEAVIYKLCRDYVGVGQTPYITLENFRDYMGLKPNEYDDFRRLSVRVIREPCEKINESQVSEISVAPEYETKGRKVIGLRFLVKKKHQASIPFPELEPNPAFRFAKVHVDSNLQSQYLALRAPEEIELCIDRANEYAETQEKAGNEVNLGAVYRKAITEGWHTQHAEKKARKKSVAVEMQKKAEEKQQEKTAKEEALREATAKNIAELDKFDAMPEDIKRRIREEYLKSVELPALRRAFEKEGERHPMHRSVFVQFLYKNVNT
jgi:hypothetical protein